MLKAKWFLLGVLPLAVGVASCSSGGDSSAKTTTTIASTTSTLDLSLVGGSTTTAVPAEVTTTTIVSGLATATNWEVVVGIFPTKLEAQTQIDKLTAAKFAGFTIKTLTSTFAVVKVGFTGAEASALMKQINTAGVGTATVFQLIDPTATNFEVVQGIYVTEADAQAQIDKLTAAKFTDFTIKPVTGKFAVVKAGLTSAEASALVKQVDAAGLGPSRVKQL